MFLIKSYVKQQIKIDYLPKKRASAQIQIEQCSNFRWLHAKALKLY